MKHHLLFLLFLALNTQGTPAIFYIEGNTGSGKTTILRAFSEKNKNVVVLEEPVAAVQNVEGINALQMMYENQERWALTVNFLYYVFHIQNLQNAIEQFPNRIIISDRSLFSGHAFCYADWTAEVLHPLEPILYRELSRTTSSLVPKPHGFIYMRTDPEVSFQRICTRNRKEEAHIANDYWHSLHEGHEQMLIHNKPAAIADVPVLIINCNENMHRNPSFISDTVLAIEQFIEKCVAAKN